MRIPIIAAALLAATAPLPALAQDAERDSSLLTEKLADPANVERLSAMLGVMMEAMMDLPVGQMSEAMGEASDSDAPEMDPDATLRDVMGPDADEIPATMAERLPRMLAMMGVMAEALEGMRPQLREAAERIERDMPDTE